MAKAFVRINFDKKNTKDYTFDLSNKNQNEKYLGFLTLTGVIVEFAETFFKKVKIIN